MSPVGAKVSSFWQFLLSIIVLLTLLVCGLFIFSLFRPPVPIPTAIPTLSFMLTVTPFPPLTTQALVANTSPVVVNILNTPKVERAVIHLLGSGDADDFDQNILALNTGCSSGQYVSVWAPGYYILTFPCSNNPSGRYDVQLEPINPTDDLNYQWVSAGKNGDPSPNCASCHSSSFLHLNEYSEWQKDGHSKVFADPYFWTSYLGQNVNRQPSQQIQWSILDDGQRLYPLLDPMQPNYGAGYRLDYPVSNGNCVTCHVPADFPDTLNEASILKLIGDYTGGHTSAAVEGITCDICHKVTDVLVGKDQLPYDDRPGLLSMSTLRPISTQHFTYGPLAYQSNLSIDSNPNFDAKRTCFPIFSESKFCASCHYGKFANTLIYGSYKEWLDSSYSKPQDLKFRTCQDCHMLDEGQIQSTQPSERAACSETNIKFNFTHNMMNYGPDPKNPQREIPRLVVNAAQIGLQATSANGQIKVKVTVQNTGAGHKFPTDSPLRHLLLVIKAKDWRGSPLVQAGGPRIPVWAAPDWGGYAGEIYANLLKDKDTNLVPSFAYWNPVEMAWQGADTRLPPGVPIESDYLFAAPYDQSITISAKLIYRRAFINVINQKGWPPIQEDIEVTSAAIMCTGFDISSKNMRCEPVAPDP